ncbi:MAG: hypothetical protein CME70_14090 [Halobacteriovorax sp.]|nr:hypothetical protein [Halobacteriovorax sp.]|tara:strand:+ start:1167 stop:1724 length:558 start_codon:yes stop_codon:yes gene_type:complete
MKPNKQIALTFAKRQTPLSRFSHFEGTESELISLIIENLDNAFLGYRSGVYHVPVPATKFKSGIVELQEGDPLYGSFESRKQGEEPRKVIMSGSRDKLPAMSAEIILYHRTVLEEEAGYKAAADWEIISINASPISTPTPQTPQALIANHFELSGGTKTRMSSDKFESALRESVMFWKNKVMCGS